MIRTIAIKGVTFCDQYVQGDKNLYSVWIVAFGVNQQITSIKIKKCNLYENECSKKSLVNGRIWCDENIPYWEKFLK